MSLEWIKDVVVFDRSLEDKQDVWYSFAVDELLSEQVHRQQQVICHLWRHKGAVILGQRDSRLPYVREAIEEIERQGYQTCIRHSGGAAVPLDENVLNVSLIFPAGYISESSYHDGFEKMFELIRAICIHMPYHINKGEIVGAYCPGDYDLSINGLKFCGIAQRRKIKAYIVQAFINVDGDSVKRAERIKQFYVHAAKDKQDADYPVIVPNTLASLAQFGTFLSESLIATNHLIEKTEVQAFIKKLIYTVKSYKLDEQENVIIAPTDELIKQQAERLKQRYSLE